VIGSAADVLNVERNLDTECPANVGIQNNPALAALGLFPTGPIPVGADGKAAPTVVPVTNSLLVALCPDKYLLKFVPGSVLCHPCPGDPQSVSCGAATFAGVQTSADVTESGLALNNPSSCIVLADTPNASANTAQTQTQVILDATHAALQHAGVCYTVDDILLVYSVVNDKIDADVDNLLPAEFGGFFSGSGSGDTQIKKRLWNNVPILALYGGFITPFVALQVPPADLSLAKKILETRLDQLGALVSSGCFTCPNLPNPQPFPLTCRTPVPNCTPVFPCCAVDCGSCELPSDSESDSPCKKNKKKPCKKSKKHRKHKKEESSSSDSESSSSEEDVCSKHKISRETCGCRKNRPKH